MHFVTWYKAILYYHNKKCFWENLYIRGEKEPRVSFTKQFRRIFPLHLYTKIILNCSVKCIPEPTNNQTQSAVGWSSEGCMDNLPKLTQWGHKRGHMTRIKCHMISHLYGTSWHWYHMIALRWRLVLHGIVLSLLLHAVIMNNRSFVPLDSVFSPQEGTAQKSHYPLGNHHASHFLKCPISRS